MVKVMMKVMKVFIALAIFMAHFALCQATWAPIPTQNLKFTTCAVMNKNKIWAVDTTGKAHRWDGKTWKTKPHTTTIKQVTIAQDGTAFIIDSTGKIFRDVSILLQKINQKIARAQAALAKLTTKKQTTLKEFPPTSPQIITIETQIKQQQAQIKKLTTEKQTLLTGQRPKPVTPTPVPVPVAAPGPVPVAAPEPVAKPTPAPKPETAPPPQPMDLTDPKQRRLKELETTEKILKGQLTVLPKSVQGPLLKKIKQIQEEREQLLE